jgi:hypothetical protein
VFIDTSFEPLNLLTECMDRAMRGNLTSSLVVEMVLEHRPLAEVLTRYMLKNYPPRVL